MKFLKLGPKLDNEKNISNRLQDESGEKITLGLVAQLNSASDYGSEGCRFESCRGHI